MTDAVAVEKLRGQDGQGNPGRQGRQEAAHAGIDARNSCRISASKSVEQLRELVRVFLERRLEYSQRQSAREQVLSTSPPPRIGNCLRIC